MTARWHDDVFALLRRGAAPHMPDGKCIGQAHLFDGNTPDDIQSAITQCRTCPELTPCRQWAANSTGLTGVIAGHHHKPKEQNQ